MILFHKKDLSGQFVFPPQIIGIQKSQIPSRCLLYSLIARKSGTAVFFIAYNFYTLIILSFLKKNLISIIG